MSLRPYYDDGKGIVIYHGDCRKIAPECLDIEGVVVTDPPYGVTDHSWDVVVPALLWMRGAACIATASEPYATTLINTAPLPFRYDLVWEKNTASNAMNAKCMPMRTHERVLVFGEPDYKPIMRRRSRDEMLRLNKRQRQLYDMSHPGSIIRVSAVNNRNLERTAHPSQKPVGLMDWIIRSFVGERIIFDPFMGSGTTLVAAKRLGRKAIGIEIEEKYCEVAVQRLAQGALDLFGEASA